MHTVPREEINKERAILVGVRWGITTAQTVDEHLEELGLLAETAGAHVVGQIVQRLDRPDPATFIGSGKADSLIKQAEALECDLIIVDDDLSPSQHRNLQKLAGEEIKVIDRSGLILDIFAKHAKSREAKTQVELARLEYMLPRLTGLWTHLERQKGGIGTRGGMGESQIEIDRRITRDKIGQYKKELKHIEQEQKTQRQGRTDLFKVALVGYTNAGKSTLLNAMTDADVYVEDQLFATLDTTTRKLELSNGQAVLLSDTVGFIRKLPHNLVASFRTTLSEVTEADLILKLLDASSPQISDHNAAIEDVLGGLGLGGATSLVVLNKIDLIEDKQGWHKLNGLFPDALTISAKAALRLDTLEDAILAAYSKDFETADLRIVPAKSYLLSQAHEKLEVLDTTYEEDVAVLKVRGLPSVIAALVKQADA